MSTWKIYSNATTPASDEFAPWPEAPPWRRFDVAERDRIKGEAFRISDTMAEMVDLAIYLRRPLLLTGTPGVGKSSLALSIAQRLRLDLFKWPISTRTTMLDGLYRYDALARLRDSQQGDEGLKRASDIGRYIKLGPLGTAFYASSSGKPCVLLIDELDKGDIDLPNDLLNIFEEGEFEIPEVLREIDQRPADTPLRVRDDVGREVLLKLRANGRIRCAEFPIVVMTSNGERDFPPAFMRRCLPVEMQPPTPAELREIVRAHFGDESFAANESEIQSIINDFNKHRSGGINGTDQLLNLLHLVLHGLAGSDEDRQKRDKLKDVLWRSLSQSR